MRKDLKKEVENIIRFYSLLGVNLDKKEFLKSLPNWADDKRALEILENLGYVLRNSDTKRVKILEDKYKKLLKLRKLFSFVPFVDFVILAGSMAIGNVHKKSDFDVIVGAESNRMFTARFLAAILFSIRGVRRSKDHSKEESNNKICLNHFVTPQSYNLSGPYNIYWEQLYRNLVPIYGNKERVIEFFEENSWANIRIEIDDDILYEKKSFIARFGEFILGGVLGDFIEKFLSKFQLSRIKRGEDDFSNVPSRLEYGKDELRFHVDISRIEKIVNDVNNRK